MRLLPTLAVLALSACSAGSTGGGAAPPQPAVAGATASSGDTAPARGAPPPDLAEAAARESGASGLTEAITHVERTEFGMMLNDVRGNLAMVSGHDVLHRVAQDYTSEIEKGGRSIAAGDNLHVGLDGSTVGDRVARAGYDYRWVGENIAQGYSRGEDVLDAWMNSRSGHREVILAPQARDFGLGRTDETWVLIMGAER